MPDPKPFLRATLGALERWHRMLLATLIAWLALLMAVSARDKAFWHDEIYTILGAGMPVRTLWRASIDGVDLSPPLNTIVTHFVQSLAGVGPVATRIPAMAGFLAAALAVFTMAR